MPRPRLDDAQQAALLDATVRVIAARGTEKTRLLDVAREVGRSTGTLQHYFGSRDELFAAAFRRLNDVAADRARVAAAAIADPWTRLVSVIDAILGTDPDWRDEWQIWLEFWAACARDPDLRALTGDVYATWRALLLEAIAEGAATNAFRPAAPPAEIAAALLATVDGTALHGLLAINALGRAAAGAIVVRLAASYLGVDEARTA